ncbi:unnamed protein product [Parnassius apollo]|uniref:(apollo) hypothetical protein n=1 Tax=Parnassius apollo TaxID=110799 RepID=A0A8S3WY41_PARAO|nr:unnamed protein product [Parnassius apollo]
MEGECSESAEGWLLVRVHVPELNVQKSLQFPRDQLVWDVKQQCLAALPKTLVESLLRDVKYRKILSIFTTQHWSAIASPSFVTAVLPEQAAEIGNPLEVLLKS